MITYRDVIFETNSVNSLNGWFAPFEGAVANLWDSTQQDWNPSRVVSVFRSGGPPPTIVILARFEDWEWDLLAATNIPATINILAVTDPFEPDEYDLTDPDNPVLLQINGDVFRALDAAGIAAVREVWPKDQIDPDTGPFTAELRFARFAGHFKPEFIEP